MMNAYERRRIAFHEAGHALMAAHEGFETGTIAVHHKGGSAETTAKLPDASIIEFVASRSRVLIAGVVAQCIVLDPGNNQCVPLACEKDDARDDWRKAQEHLLVLTHDRIRQSAEPCDDPDALCQAISNEIFAEVGEILEQNRDILDALAQEVISLFDALFDHDPDDLEAPLSLQLDKSRVASRLQGIKKITPLPSS
ncbi:hypothetical protein [Sphingobium sp. YC-XJ3]|uniref:hypothetical protein n=1 Tax=Sphingobium sp. YC-XJ3 TaxID=3024245 RepID=UPI0023601950|nr:hypothetical protein [Sphingobium sp. YC-XJ3]WDA35122.1 hypothetical protein PO876_16855 [Sphingobium sp. YC-XJ3]